MCHFPNSLSLHRVYLILLREKKKASKTNKTNSPSFPLPCLLLVTPRAEKPAQEIHTTCSCNDFRSLLLCSWKSASQFRQTIQCIVSKLVFSLKELQETFNLVNYSILLCKRRTNGLRYMAAPRFCSKLSNRNQLVGIEVVNLSLGLSSSIKASGC